VTSTYRLSFGTLVARSIGIYLRNLPPFVVLAAIALAPWILVQLRGDAWEEAYFGSGARRGGGPFRWFPLTQFASIGAMLVGTHSLHGVVAFAVGRRLRGETASFGASVAAGARSFPRSLLLATVCTVLIALGVVGLYVGALIVAMHLYVATPAAAVERLGVGTAIRRSAHLVLGSRWPIFGALLLAGAVHFGSKLLLVFVAANLGLYRAWPWLEFAATVLLAPFGAVLAAVAYFMLRDGKENADARKIAAVFD
jgi:hypothetical protein